MTKTRREALALLGGGLGALALGKAFQPMAAQAQSLPGENVLSDNELTPSYVREDNLPEGSPLEGFINYRTGEPYVDTQDEFKLVYCGAAEDVFAGEGRRGCGDDLFDMAIAIGHLKYMTRNPIHVRPVFIIPHPVEGQDRALLDGLLSGEGADIYEDFDILSAENRHVARFALLNLASSYAFNDDGTVQFHMRNANLKEPNGRNMAIYRGSFSFATDHMYQKLQDACSGFSLRSRPACEA